jgi:hypothetical protein
MKLRYVVTPPFDAPGRSDRRTTRITSIKNNNFFVNVCARESELVRGYNNFPKKMLLFSELLLCTAESTITNGTGNVIS